jgi:plastocyanin
VSELRTEERIEESHEEPTRGGLPPILYPVLALLFIGLLVFSFSRILLALSEIEEVDLPFVDLSGKIVTALVALFAAMNILVGAALVAYGRRVRGLPASWPLLAAAAVVVIAGGIVALGIGEPGEVRAGGPGSEEPGDGGPPEGTIALAADNLAFDTAEIAMPAGAPIVMEFENREATPHNFAMYTDESAATPIFQGEVVTGPATVEYEFEAPEPGEYFFRCDVHPAEMTGTVDVGPPGPGGGGGDGGGGGGAVELTANNLAFDPSDLTVPAGGEVRVTFTNEEAVPHNFAVYTDETASEAIFQGEILTGPGASIDYTFEAPGPGEYFFRCDVHPDQMTGSLLVE